MFIVANDPNEVEEWEKSAKVHTNINDARRTASKLSVQTGKACIFRLEMIVIPTGAPPVQAYKVKDNGDILPCD